jgi:hypothetical protein
MQASLPPLLAEGILVALQFEYKARAQEILALESSWDWAQWDELVEEIAVLGLSVEDPVFDGQVLACVRCKLRAHVRLASQNAHHVCKSDQEMLRELEDGGLGKGHGEIFGANNCCADSLLQLLIWNGILSSGISKAEREAACAGNRSMLNASDPALGLRPRRRDAFSGSASCCSPEEDAGAFLQHDVHAGPTISFFMEWFKARGQKLRDLPDVGVQLQVRSRFDSEVLPPDTCVVCQREVGCVEEPALLLQLYNLTGDGVSGSHYDPLFPSGGAGEAAGPAPEEAVKPTVEPVWKRYTPAVVNADMCMARTWAKAKGGQCSKPPAAGARLCSLHEKQSKKQSWLGFVDGEVPAPKLIEFERHRTDRQADPTA